MFRLFIFSLITFVNLVSFSVSAGCYTNQSQAKPEVMSFSPSDIIVQRDVPVGTILQTFATGQSYSVLYCRGGGTDYHAMSIFNIPTNMEHVYKTNVPGVGISIGNGSNSFFDNPAFAIAMTGNKSVLINSKDVTFIKIGDITSGKIDSGEIGRTYGDDGVTGLSYQITGQHVIQLACSIMTPTLTFPLGNILESEFGNKVGFSPSQTSTQNLGLNCDPGANINVQLNATQNPDTQLKSVLALDSDSRSGGASGLGVQLMYNGSPLEIGKNMVLKESSGGQETFPITARYYQTKTVVTTGDANTSATLSLTYQ